MHRWRHWSQSQYGESLTSSVWNTTVNILTYRLYTHTHSVHALPTVRLMQKTRDREITRNGWQKQSTLGRSGLYEIFLKRIQHYITRLPVLNASFIFNVCVPVTSWDASTSDFTSFIAVFRNIFLVYSLISVTLARKWFSVKRKI